MRTALQDLAGDFDLRLALIVAVLLARPARVLRNAAGLRCVRLVPGRIEIAGPFPDIADHVEQPIAVRRERIDRRRACEAIAAEVLMRKFSLPGVGEMLAFR